MKTGATNIDKAIGAKIKECRIEAGMSQTALGNAVDVSFQQVQKYENGTNRVSVATLLLIAETFEVPINVLLPDGRRGKKQTGALRAVNRLNAAARIIQSEIRVIRSHVH